MLIIPKSAASHKHIYPQPQSPALPLREIKKRLKIPLHIREAGHNSISFYSISTKV